MYKIAVMGDYDSIYGFATLGLSICPVKDRDEAKTKLRQLAEGNYGIIYITEAVAAQIPSEINTRLSKNCQAKSIGGKKRVKGNRQGFLSRPITRRSGRIAK